MSLFLDIGTGAGLAGASGVRPFLPPLLAGALARGDVAIDFDGTDWSFLESPAFLLAVFAAAVLTHGAERSLANRPTGEAGSGAAPLTWLTLVAGVALGALLFAGSLADGGHDAWPGLVAGVACAALGWRAVGGVLERARHRLDAGAAGLLGLYADATALLLAALAVLVPPVSFLALVGFVVLLLGSGRRAGEKYAGLRVLR